MRKKVAMLLSLVFILSFVAGCGNSNTGDDFALCKVKTDKYVTTLGEYTGLTIEAARQEITSELIEYFKDYYYMNIAQAGIPGETAKLGDTVSLDFAGSIDGVAFEGGSAADYLLELGSHSFIDDFEDQLVGLKAGDSKDVNVTFPDDYGSAELAGKDAVFACTIKAVIPAFSEDALKKLNNPDFPDMAAYDVFIDKKLNEISDSEYRDAIINGAFEQIEAASVIKDIPAELLNMEVKYVYTNYNEQAASYGMNVPDYLANYGTTVDDIAKANSNRQLLYQTIANKQDLTVSDEEVDAKAAEEVSNNEGINSVEEFFAITPRETFRNYLMIEKVNDYIIENATVVEPKDEETAATAE